MPNSEDLNDDFSSTREAILRPISVAEKSVRKVWIFVTAMIFLISLSYGLAGNGAPSFSSLSLRAFATLAVAAFAASCVGYAVGFLFGTPKLLQRGVERPAGASENTDRSPKRLLLTNTSLEEISDWLTKIIIGLGLVQFDKFVDEIGDASDSLAALAFGNGIGVCAQSCQNPAAAFFFSLIVGCLVLALILGYLQTRTRLTLMFLGVEGANVRAAAEIEKAAMQPVMAAADDATATRQRQSGTPLEASDEDKKLAQMTRDQMKSPMEVAGWASAVARTGGSLQVSEDALRFALQREPSNIEILMRLAEVCKLNGNYTGYVSTVAEIIKNPRAIKTDISALVRGAVLDALYLPPSFGYERAITLATYLLESGPEISLKDRPKVFLWRAAAYAQMYSYLKSQSFPGADDARKHALADVNALVELVPNNEADVRRLLQQMFDPKGYDGVPTDNDLEIFKDDIEFRKVILEDKD